MSEDTKRNLQKLIDWENKKFTLEECGKLSVIKELESAKRNAMIELLEILTKELEKELYNLKHPSLF